MNKGTPLRYLRILSLIMTALGVASILASLLLDADSTIALVGMLLVVAGAVKIAVVRLWHGVAGFGAPLHVESASTRVPRKE